MCERIMVREVSESFSVWRSARESHRAGVCADMCSEPKEGTTLPELRCVAITLLI